MSPFTDTHTAAATMYDLSLISLYTSLLCFEVFLLCCSCMSCVYMCMQVRMYCMGWGTKLQAWPSVYPCLLT